jgi:hypothetical protein
MAQSNVTYRFCTESWNQRRQLLRAGLLKGNRVTIFTLSFVSWVVFAGYRIWRTVAGPPWIWSDSRTYIAAARAPFASTALLAGPRPPLAPILWKLTGTAESYVLTQTIIGVITWTVLALTVAHLVRRGWPALLAGVVVLAFASCWPVLEWDWSVLSESISLSAVALITASAIWLARRVTTPRALMLVLACTLYEGARDQAIWIVGISGIGACACVSLAAAVHPPSASSRRTHRGILIIGIVLITIAGAAEAGAAHAHRNVVNVEDVFDVRVFPYPARVAWFADHGMPQATGLDRLAHLTTAGRGQAKVVAPDLAAAIWKPLRRWFSTSSQAVFVEYLASDPLYALTAPFQRPELTYNNANGNLAFYGDINNGTRTFLPLLAHIFFPSWQIVTTIGVAAMTVVTIRKGQRRLVVPLVALLLTGLIGMLVAWQGDGTEIARHAVEGNIQSRIVVLVFLLIALLAPADPSNSSS